MKRATSIAIAVLFLVLGTKVLDRMHAYEHAAEDAAAAAAATHEHDAPVHHDETNCAVHLMLQAPLLMQGHVALLICLGLFVAFLSLVAPPLLSQAVQVRLKCRDPPVLA